jgi:hypothetical protein
MLLHHEQSWMAQQLQCTCIRFSGKRFFAILECGQTGFSVHPRD